MTFIVACGAEATATPTPTPRPAATPTPQTVATATPTPTSTPTVVPKLPVVSRLKVAIVPPPIQSTVGHITGYGAGGVIRPMYESLVGVNDDTGDLVPDLLATEWKVSSDARDWTFKLRKGVLFHNGTEFTARDVVRSWQVYTLDNSVTIAPAFFRTWVGKKENLEIVNPYEMVWHLTEPNLGLVTWISDDIVFRIYSDEHWEKVGESGYIKDPIGTGPFRFVELVQNSHILYQRVKNHWRKTPEMEELQFLYVNEGVTRVAMLLSKEVHMSDIPRNLFRGIRDKGYNIGYSTRPGVFLWVMFGGQYYVTPPDQENKFDPTDPLTNLKVRKAMSLAINRKQLNDTFLEGTGEPQVIHGMYQRERPFKSGWVVDPYDPKRARELLVEAGYPNGFDLPFLTFQIAGFPEGPEMAEAVAGYWSAVGIKVKIREVESREANAKARARDLRSSAVMRVYGWVTHELTWPLNLVIRGNDPLAYHHPETDALARQFSAAVDPAERLELAHRIGDHLYDNQVTIPLFWIRSTVVMDPSVVEYYSANLLNIGPTMKHEYTRLVKR